MAKERIHFSKAWKAGMLQPLMSDYEAWTIANVCDQFTFQTLKELAAVIAKFAKGKEA